MSILEIARQNLAALRANPYPGRGIVVGLTPDGARFAQVYWLMGRSENSRNRVLVRAGDTVRAEPFDASRVQDPSLILYNCARVCGRAHIVTNGDHTDTVHAALAAGRAFEEAVRERTFEPDAPNFTPRIAAVVNLDDRVHAYQIAILKAAGNDPALPVRQVFSYGAAAPGIGHFVSTYSGDGSPLPPFSGEPQPMELPGKIELACDLFWSALNEANRVSLLVKFIDRATGATEARIVNRHGRRQG
jgi:IMP cyclohydrolase